MDMGAEIFQSYKIKLSKEQIGMVMPILVTACGRAKADPKNFWSYFETAKDDYQKTCGLKEMSVAQQALVISVTASLMFGIAFEE